MGVSEREKEREDSEDETEKEREGQQREVETLHEHKSPDFCWKSGLSCDTSCSLISTQLPFEISFKMSWTKGSCECSKRDIQKRPVMKLYGGHIDLEIMMHH